MRAPELLYRAGVGAVAATLGLLAWFVSVTDTWVQPDWFASGQHTLPTVAVPFTFYDLTAPVPLLGVGWILAGAYARWRMSSSPRWSVAALFGGVLLVQLVALAQSVIVFADLAPAKIGVLALFLVGSLVVVALGCGLAVVIARARVPIATVALAVGSVFLAAWVARLADPAVRSLALDDPFRAVRYAFPLLDGVAVGALLVWCGARPAVRLVAWMLSLGALCVVRAVMTGLGVLGIAHVLGASQPGAEAVTYGWGVLTQPASWLGSVALALAIGLFVTAVRGVSARRRRAAAE